MEKGLAMKLTPSSNTHGCPEGSGTQHALQQESLGTAACQGVRTGRHGLSQLRKQDGGDRCHSRSSRDPQDHWVSCQARSRAADGGVIGLDDLLPRRATKSGSRLRGQPPCSPIRCCGDDHGEMMRCMRTVGSRTDSQIVDARSGSQTAGRVRGSGPESRIGREGYEYAYHSGRWCHGSSRS
jgi:hypothetical protein